MARKKNTEEEDTQNEMRLKKTRRKQDVPGHPKQNTDKNSVNKGRKHRGKELDTIQKNSVCDNGETKCFVESLPSKDVSSNIRTVEEGNVIKGKTKPKKQNDGKKPQHEEESGLSGRGNSIKKLKRNLKGKTLNVKEQSDEAENEGRPIKVPKHDVDVSSSSDLTVEVGKSKYWNKTRQKTSERKAIKDNEVKNTEGDSDSTSEWEEVKDVKKKARGKTQKRNSGKTVCRKTTGRRQQIDRDSKYIKKDSTGKGGNTKNQNYEPPVKVPKHNVDASGCSDLPVEVGESRYWNKTEQKTSEGEATKDDEVKNAEDDSDSSSEEWEEVEELPCVSNVEHDDVKDQLPDKPVEIIVQGPNLLKKRGKGNFDIHDWFRLQMNKYKRKTQINVHKVHILCLLSLGIRLNVTCNNTLLQARALSLLPGTVIKTHVTSKWDISSLQKLVKWFCGEFIVNTELNEDLSKLETRLEQKEVASALELVLIFVILCRALGLRVRLVHSLQPVTFKAADLKPKTEKKAPKSSESSSQDTDGTAMKSSKCSLSSKLSSLVKKSTSKGSKRDTSKKKHSSSKKEANAVKKEGSSNEPEPKARHLPQRRCTATVCYAEPGSEESERELLDTSIQQLDGQSDRKLTCSSSEVDLDTLSQSSGDDFEQHDMHFRSPPLITRRSRSDAKKQSSGDSDHSSTSEKVYDYWSEVFLEKVNRWICVDCIHGEVDHPEAMEHRASKPLCYVLGYDNSGIVKDVTRRYAGDYLIQMRRFRVDPGWWQETLECFGPKTHDRTEIDDAEESELEAKLQKQPFPTTISEFKNHPLYALKRHLLKFEAIYPESAVPLGYIKSEPIYARECIHTLHSRENWLKEGRIVKIGEEPYKMVKSRKRPSVFNTDQNKANLLTPLYGLWQTEEYKPPPAVDGKVPKNEYGNVELFKPSMLPPGTVHLKLPGLNKIAKKLDIDCAPAMVGWEQHAFFAHPLMDGFIVCKEHEEILINAWHEEESIRLEKEAQVRQQRAEDNWKRLVKGLLLREKMKIKFKLQEPKEIKVNKGDKEVNKADDMALSWPRNRQTERSDGPRKEASTPFPFEVEQM